jgi:hypothetical protein
LATVTITVMASEDGTVTIPRDAVEKLGFHPGERAHIALASGEIAETSSDLDYDSILDRLFDEAANLVLEPGEPLSDPLEAAWGAGVEEKYRKMGLKL